MAKNKRKQQGTVEAGKLMAEMDNNQNVGSEMETRLSIPHTWDMSEESRHVYAFYNSQSPKLQENQISIYGMELNQYEPQKIMITGLIRSTVSQHIHFEEADIILLDKDEKPLAKKKFDLSGLGTLPPRSARPWDFHFEPENFLKNDIETIEDGWTLAFELKKEHQLDMEPSWEESLDDASKAILENIVAEAAPLGENEVNMLGVKAEYNDNEDLVITLLIRNGNVDKNMNIEQLPLKVMDASNKEVARGTFTMENFTVKANTSKPWAFIFPKASVADDIDLSRWKAIAITD